MNKKFLLLSFVTLLSISTPSIFFASAAENLNAHDQSIIADRDRGDRGGRKGDGHKGTASKHGDGNRESHGQRGSQWKGGNSYRDRGWDGGSNRQLYSYGSRAYGRSYDSPYYRSYSPYYNYYSPSRYYSPYYSYYQSPYYPGYNSYYQYPYYSGYSNYYNYYTPGLGLYIGW